MNDYESERALHQAMRLAGWEYDPKTHGFRKGAYWVTWGQAELALQAAEAKEAQVIVPASESLAEIVAGAVNDGFVQ